MIFENTYSILDNKEIKLKFETPPMLIIDERKKANPFLNFLIKYRNDIDKLLLFLMYSFANIENFEKKFNDIKELFETKDKAYNEIELFLNERELENVNNFLNDEVKLNKFLYKLQKIENKTEKNNFFLFSLDIIFEDLKKPETVKEIKINLSQKETEIKNNKLIKTDLTKILKINFQDVLNVEINCEKNEG